MVQLRSGHLPSFTSIASRKDIQPVKTCTTYHQRFSPEQVEEEHRGGICGARFTITKDSLPVQMEEEHRGGTC